MGFWKRKPKETSPSPVALWLVEKTGKVKERWVALMIRLTAKLSTNQQKVAFLMLGLLCCAYCTFLIVRGFTVTEHNRSIPVNSISNPARKIHTVHKDAYHEGEVKRVRQLLHTLDSIKADPKGRWEYDSIARHRPGLLDTLRKLEKYYKTE